MLGGMAQTPQTYANHIRFVPLFHGVAMPILAASLVWTVWRAVRSPGADTVMAALMAVALVIVIFASRVFALIAQDRVIRLEVRLRMKDVLPPAMHARIKDFTPGQLVALRFAGDAELPALADAVLRDQIQDKKTIKRMIKDWQGDDLRV